MNCLFDHQRVVITSVCFFKLSFIAELPPLSLVVYHVTKAPPGSTPRARYTVYRPGSPLSVQSDHFQVSALEGSDVSNPLSLSNKHFQIWSSPATGLLQVLQFRIKAQFLKTFSSCRKILNEIKVQFYSLMLTEHDLYV